MAIYTKKDKYPTISLKGLYPPGSTDKELGLNSDDLENISLGNWNSIYKNQRIIKSFISENFDGVYASITDRLAETDIGRPVQIRFGANEFRGKLLDDEDSPLISYLAYINTENEIEHIVEGINDEEGAVDVRAFQLGKIGNIEAAENFSFAQATKGYSSSGNRIMEGIKSGQRNYAYRQSQVLNYYFGNVQQGVDYIVESMGGNTGQLVLPDENIIDFEDGTAYIVKRGNVGSLDPNSSENNAALNGFELVFDNNLLQKIKDLVFINPIPNTDLQNYGILGENTGDDPYRPLYGTGPFGGFYQSLDVDNSVRNAADAGIDWLGDVIANVNANGIDSLQAGSLEQRIYDKWLGYSFLNPNTSPYPEGANIIFPTHEIFFPRHFTMRYLPESPLFVVGIDLGRSAALARDSDGNIASNVDLGGDTYSNLTVATTNWDNDRTHTSDLIQEHEDAGGNSDEEGELQDGLYPKFPLPDGYTVNSQVQDNPFTTNSLNVNSYMKTFFDRQKYTYDNISTYTADDFNELGDPYYDFQFEFSSITTQFNDESSDLAFTAPQIDYQVNTYINETETFFLYYDFKSPLYNPTSYPIRIEIDVSLWTYLNFDNEQTLPIDLEILESGTDAYYNFINQYYKEDAPLFEEVSETNILDPTNSYYRYSVIQWGDEDVLLSDDTIKDSYYFNFYDVNDDDFEQNGYDIKMFKIIQKESKPITEKLSHIYTTPGIKSIKILVWRFSSSGLYTLSSTLVTKNININDSTLTSQDFSIFGGTDFTFLPLSVGSENKYDSIIGGLNNDSDYNNSVEKIRKDDNFTKEDYLNRITSKLFIDNFNNGFYGNDPGQLDLGLTRVYKKPSDLYSFLNADVNSFVDTQFPSTHIYDQGNRIQTLPINSSATDIFIDDENCVIDVNPENMEYLTIPNRAGTQDKSILIGDYKVNQPKDGKVSKQGNMKISKVERNKNKQAF